jgi:AraC-like DNA-binding protein
MWGSVAMRSLAFPDHFAKPAMSLKECRVLSVTPLLRELILRIVSMQAIDSRVPLQRRLWDVLLDEMNHAHIAPLLLPLPADSRALTIAQHILECPGADESCSQLARRSGASRRTLERLFQSETGLSFGLWRQKARLLESLRLLSEGKSVTDAALDSGYAGVSAYIAAFKKTFGCTPGRI